LKTGDLLLSKNAIHMVSAMALHGWSRKVGGKSQGLQRTRKQPLPEGFEIVEELSSQAPTLPASKVRILDGQVIQYGIFSDHERAIELRKLSHEDPCRPTIRDDVMEDDDQQRVSISKALQRPSKEGTEAKIEDAQMLFFRKF